jgi:peptidyl-prolyl cis-trans isomerase SurA
MGSAYAQEKLLDKIVAVINNRVISLSEVLRAEQTIDARKEVSPMIYTEAKYDRKKLLDIMIRSVIVRDKINAQGYVINDEAVESRIKMTEEKLGLRRSDLLNFLKMKGLTFEEYFQIIRETMEYNIFSSRIIAPLVSVTEQEVKNEYYRLNSTNSALAFKYNLVDFFISEDKLIDKDKNKFLSVLRDYQLTGKLTQEYSSLETNNLEELTEDALPLELSTTLKNTAEGAFSKPVLLNGYLHSFYVQKKDLVESKDFGKIKDKIQNDIFTNKSVGVTNNWFDREYSNYYIKILL